MSQDHKNIFGKIEIFCLKIPDAYELVDSVFTWFGKIYEMVIVEIFRLNFIASSFLGFLMF
jgi:hypothetical protein